ncbi:hypothetical protein N9R11_05460, partial [Polaribacter sp.]|nr:hypothetical protein [Polaribacter sp.]
IPVLPLSFRSFENSAWERNHPQSFTKVAKINELCYSDINEMIVPKGSGFSLNIFFILQKNSPLQSRTQKGR